MKKETWLFVGVALIVGILVGVLVANRAGRRGGSTSAPPPTSTQAPAVNYQQQIQMLEEIVAKDPGNRDAWIRLGHSYFDSNQPMKAVKAYDKALELDGNDPDILTDQGIMFRRLGWYDRAVENFKRAYEIDPAHQQSLYNLGIVYRFDLKDMDKARQAWEKYLELNPSGPGSQQVRKELEVIKSHPRMPSGDMPGK
jgi:cytochrome c-type biogenesis protein CcmH/NrfG